jgi:hypothetical protein
VGRRAAAAFLSGWAGTTVPAPVFVALFLPARDGWREVMRPEGLIGLLTMGAIAAVPGLLIGGLCADGVRPRGSVAVGWAVRG